jgi:pimeloyl-ACP methyl ester carboxylesterase
VAEVDVVVELFARLTGRAVAVACGETLRDGRTLRWVRIGEVAAGDDGQGPVVVMEAGLGEPTLTWAPVLAGLAEVVGAVVVYDRAGVGLSGSAHGEHGGEAQLVDLVAVIEDVGRGVRRLADGRLAGRGGAG